MATWEEELKEAEELRNLMQAEYESNAEELSQRDPYRNRTYYLELRNEYLKVQIKKKEERLRNIRHNIEWDARTR